MKKVVFILFCFFIANCISCQNIHFVLPSMLNGAWEDAGRDFSSEVRVITSFKQGKADVVELHSFVFFIGKDNGVIYTSDQAFIITETDSLSRERVRIRCYPQGGSPDNLYTYVFKVRNEAAIDFLLSESSSPLFPAKLKKGGEVYP